MKHRLLTDRAILRRSSNILLDSVDGNTTATLTLDLEMPDPAYLLIEADDGGSGFITGVVSGVTMTEALTEALTIPSDGILKSENEFASVVGMTFSNIAGEISIRAVERQGQPKMFYEDVCGIVPCRVFDKSSVIVPSGRGETREDQNKVYVDWDHDRYRLYNRDVLYVYDPKTPSIPGITIALKGVRVQRGKRGRPSFYSARGIQIN